MKSDETAYQELFEELEKYENKGVYISMDDSRPVRCRL